MLSTALTQRLKLSTALARRLKLSTALAQRLNLSTPVDAAAELCLLLRHHIATALLMPSLAGRHGGQFIASRRSSTPRRLAAIQLFCWCLSSGFSSYHIE